MTEVAPKITWGRVLETTNVGTYFVEAFGFRKEHDTQCEAVFPSSLGDGGWGPCHCAERREAFLATQHRLDIFKKKKNETRHADIVRPAPEGIWIAVCRKCDKRVTQYWDFGATLGAALEHQRRCRD